MTARLGRTAWRAAGTAPATPGGVVILRPALELRAPGQLTVRYEWPEELQPCLQGELVEAVRRSSAGGPVGLIFVLAPRIHRLEPAVRGFWRGVVQDPALRLRAMAVVTASWAVEVEARGFGVTNALSGRPLQLAVFEEEGDAAAWMARAIRRAPLARPAT